MIYFKIHTRDNARVLAACDKELMGKKLKHNETEFNVSEHFYRGKEATETEFKEMLKEHENINLLGKKTVEIALAENLISEKSIITISGVPHAQIFRV